MIVVSNHEMINVTGSLLYLNLHLLHLTSFLTLKWFFSSGLMLTLTPEEGHIRTWCDTSTWSPHKFWMPDYACLINTLIMVPINLLQNSDLSKNKNYETYYRSARVQVRTISKYFLTLLNNFLGLFRSILLYLGLPCFLLVYLTLSRFILSYLGLSWSIMVFLCLCQTILDSLGLSWTVSDYLRLFQTILDYLGLYWTISDYLGLYRIILDYLGLCQNFWDYLGLGD